MTLEQLDRRLEILLVEDNRGDVLLTREACESAATPMQLSVVSDGEEALEVLRGERAAFETYRPDLILLDLNLPGMDGRELLAIIKADPTLKCIPVIVLASSKAEIGILRSYDLQASSYIVKPVEFERLQEVVASLETPWRRTVSLPSSPQARTDDG